MPCVRMYRGDLKHCRVRFVIIAEPNREKSSRNFVIVILLVDEVEAKPIKVVFLARAIRFDCS